MELWRIYQICVVVFLLAAIGATTTAIVCQERKSTKCASVGRNAMLFACPSLVLITSPLWLKHLVTG